ncbi:MAG: chloramphenicol phosphotransferase CPT family protein [Actinomycetota bacterium]|nr:chloramphenicol phosphotransferase CPT family protein [Actinomycetota bacterium]
MVIDDRGQIIFLNGTSSSGKTSIAEALLPLLAPPYFHLSVDAINSLRAKEPTQRLSRSELDRVLKQTRAGFHRVVAAMAEAGNNVIADYVLSERWRLLDCLTVLRPFDVVFVGVRCSAEELVRRERACDDREIGQGAAQQAAVHSHDLYDIEFDTEQHNPSTCAALICEYLHEPHPYRAFDQLREKFGDSLSGL